MCSATARRAARARRARSSRKSANRSRTSSKPTAAPQFLGYPEVDDEGRVVGEYPVAARDGLTVLAIFRACDAVHARERGEEVIMVLDAHPLLRRVGRAGRRHGAPARGDCVVRSPTRRRRPRTWCCTSGAVESGEIARGRRASRRKSTWTAASPSCATTRRRTCCRAR